MKSLLCKNKEIVKNIVVLGLAYVTGLALAMVHGYGITGIEVIVLDNHNKLVEKTVYIEILHL